MSQIDPQRKKVVVLCAGVACMATAAVALKSHPMLVGGVMTAALAVPPVAVAGSSVVGDWNVSCQRKCGPCGRPAVFMYAGVPLLFAA